MYENGILVVTLNESHQIKPIFNIIEIFIRLLKKLKIIESLTLILRLLAKSINLKFDSKINFASHIKTNA